MLSRSLSRGDAIHALEMIHQSTTCETQEQLVQLMSSMGELLPHQAGLACIARMKNGMPDELNVLNIDYPEEYLAELSNRDLVTKDPIVLENFKTFRLQYWADTFEHTHFTPETHAVLSLAEDFGFHQTGKGVGYGHGVRSRQGDTASFFCYHGLERSRRTEAILSLLIPHFHETLRRISGPASAALPPLTPREREILQWLALGKGTWEISTILRISERTVKFHIGNLLRKLDASTRAHAVARALEYGLIEMM